MASSLSLSLSLLHSTPLPAPIPPPPTSASLAPSLLSLRRRRLRSPGIGSSRLSGADVNPHRILARSAPLVEKPGSDSRVSTIVDVDLGDRSYPIYIGSGLLNEPDLLQRHVKGKRVLVVTK